MTGNVKHGKIKKFNGSRHFKSYEFDKKFNSSSEGIIWSPRRRLSGGVWVRIFCVEDQFKRSCMVNHYHIKLFSILLQILIMVDFLFIGNSSSGRIARTTAPL